MMVQEKMTDGVILEKLELKLTKVLEIKLDKEIKITIMLSAKIHHGQQVLKKKRKNQRLFNSSKSNSKHHLLQLSIQDNLQVENHPSPFEEY